MTLCVSIAALSVSACADSTSPEELQFTEQPGLLLDGPAGFESLMTHSIVSQETPFLVTATSFGSSTCTQDAGYSSISVGARLEIRLRDMVASGGRCSRDLRAFPRHLIAEFAEPGTAEVVVIGRGEDGAHREIRRVVTVLER